MTQPFENLYNSVKSIIKINSYNYNYEYYKKTPNGMILDIPTNHQYGSTRDGYDSWKKDNIELTASYSGITSVRTLTDRSGNIDGYILETKLPDRVWHLELKEKYNEVFLEICKIMDVIDTESFRYFVENDVELSKDFGTSVMNKLRHLINVCERYDYDEDFKKLVDKIKG